MVAHSASQVGGFAPVDLPRVAVAADGTVATIHESSRVTILEIPSGVAFAEIGVDPDAAASEVAWLGTPPRLLVLSRYAAYSTAHLLDPYGPRTISEIRLEAPMRLCATVGSAALVVGALGAAVLVGGESHLMPYQFPTRAVPLAAGAAAHQFVVALTASIEEWDPQSRMPKRRLRLPRTAAITAVGGSERLVWMTTQQEPARIDVIPLVNRGQPKAHDLPEPIASISGHPRSDLVACIGAETGRLHVIDLDGRTRLRTLIPDGFDRVDASALIIGRMVGVLVAQAERPIAILPLDGRETEGELAGSAIARGEAAATAARIQGSNPSIQAEPEPEPGDDHHHHDHDDAAIAEPTSATPADSSGPAPVARPSAPRIASVVPRAGTPATPAAPAPSPVAPSARPRFAPAPTPVTAARFPATSQPQGSLASIARPAATASSPGIFRHPAPTAPARSPTGMAAAARPAPSVGERFSAWRDLSRQNQPQADPRSAPSRAPEPARDEPRSWRDEIVVWSRAIASGEIDPNVPAAPGIETLIARFELAPALHPALVLLYGAHLRGERGAAPADVARVLEHQWEEALGRGELADRCVAEYAGSRVALSPLVLRVLDELPPLTGTLVGEPGPVALLGPCVVVVAGDEPLTATAERCLAHVNGAILAAKGDPDRAALLFEARVRGAAAMLRAALSAPPTDAAIFVLDDAELADRLGVPRLS